MADDLGEPPISGDREAILSEPEPGSIVPAGTTIPAEFAALVERAEDLAAKSQAPATTRAYGSDWRDFTKWCAANGFESLPASPEVVCLYLAAVAGTLKTGTISRRLTAVKGRHLDASLASPTDHPVVQKVWAGIRREQGVAKRGKAAAKVDELRALLGTLDLDRTSGLRDRALLLIGFAGALRRSELVALDVEHTTESVEGLTLYLPRSKGDQEGEGYELGVPFGNDPLTCPVRGLRDWRQAAGVGSGPLFRAVTKHGYVSERRLSDRAVALVVKRCALAAGFDPSRYAAHSLRAGLISTVAEAGAQDRQIMEHTRHTDVKTMWGYIRGATLFKDNVVDLAGL